MLSYGQAGDQHIKIDQFGYQTGSTKVAIISKAITGFNTPDSYTPGTTFELRNAFSNDLIFSGPALAWNAGQTHAQSGDKVWWFDFSAVTTSGYFYVMDVTNNIKSHVFEINDDIYTNVLKQACRMFYYQRCNLAKQPPFADPRWADGASHRQDTACRSVSDQTNPATAKDLSGGWFDAGDFNKYVNFSHNPVHQLLEAYDENPDAFTDNFNIPESGNGIPDILDELKWELDWLLKMQLSNGSVLSKVSTLQHLSASPASADNNPRYYGGVSASATRSVASMFAHASLVFRKPNNPAMNVYADTLLERAQKAWNWITANPANSSYSNETFASANPEQSNYFQDATRTCAAVYLYAATNNATYKTYFESNYTSLQPYSWTYWYPYEPVFQSAMLYYTRLTGISATVRTNILNNCKSAVNTGNADLLPAITSSTDAYQAQLADADYVWGSSQVKSNMGSILMDMINYAVDPANDFNYLKGAEGYLHYMHGANALGMSMLSNMYGEGAENSVNEIYHAWFGDGTVYDNAKTSPNGPPHGYVTGGANVSYAPDAAYSGPVISPPQNQPPQKCYKDWNTNYPENSWQISEPAIYYQAAYIKLLSKKSRGQQKSNCYYPNEFFFKSVDSITTNSAVLHWRKVTPVTEVSYSTNFNGPWTPYTPTADSSYAATGLQPNTTYYWVTRYICSPGDTSIWMDTLSFQTLGTAVCEVPDSLLTVSVSNTTANLSWPTTGAAEYQVRYRELAVGTSPSLVIVTTNSASIIGLLAGTSYEWDVRGICAPGDTSDFSDTLSFTTSSPVVCPTPDTLTTTNITDTSAVANWNGSAGSYEFRYKPQAAGSWITSATSNSFSMAGLSAGMPYEWQVRAICSAGDTSAWSDTITFTTTIPAGPCLPPTNLFTDQLNHNSARANWDAVATATYLFRYREVNGNWIEVPESGTNYFMNGLLSDTTYFWSVRSLCSSGDSSVWSDSVTFVTDPIPFTCISPDSLFTTDITDTSAVFSWNSTDSSDFYLVYYRNSGGSWNSEVVSGTTFQLNGLDPDNNYTWSVVSICNADTATMEDTINFSTLPIPFVCMSPDSLWTVNISDTSATLNWNATDSTTTYTVYFAASGSASSPIDVTGNSFTISNLTPETDYTWLVVSVCDQDTAEMTDTVNFSTIPTPFMCMSPSTVYITNVTELSAKASWMPTDSATTYIFSYRRIPNGVPFTTTTTDTTFNLGGLQPGYTYEVSVRSICDIDSAASAKFKVFKTSKCQEPFLSPSINTTDVSALITWYSSIMDSTLVKYRQEPAGVFNQVSTIDTSITLNGLLPNTTYFVQIIQNCGGFTYGDTITFTTGSTGIGSNTIQTVINLYPNPSSDLVQLTSPIDILGVEVYDVSGKLINTITTGGKKLTIALPQTAGFYLVKSRLSTGEIVTNSVIKE